MKHPSLPKVDDFCSGFLRSIPDISQLSILLVLRGAIPGRHGGDCCDAKCDAREERWGDAKVASLSNVREPAGSSAAAATLIQVLKQCGNDLSRENVMRQAAALNDFQPSALLPGIKINTGQRNFQPIEQLRLVQFDGHTWQPIGDVLDTAFAGERKK